MNQITKAGMITSCVGLGLVMLVIVSGVAHPNPFFNYGAGLGLLLVFVSIALFLFGWIIDFKREVKHKNWTGAVLLLVIAIITVFQLFFKR